ncbi:MAG: DUF4375 domain-containing protein [Paenibacillaceae bacterium]|nr:DUF4375 domain-containing protein [Paenibacillaceae bacterium]
MWLEIFGRYGFLFNKIKERTQLKKAINKISLPKGKVQLKYDYLKSLSKDIRAQEIANHIMKCVLTRTNEDNLILMKEYSSGMKMVATTWHLQGEINNGGFYQYFDNNESLHKKEILREYYQITKDSLYLLGNTKIKEAFVEAFALFESSQREPNKQKNTDFEWNRLDNIYYENEEELLINRDEYIDKNLNEFVVN